jgi:porphobilinogen synthase
VRETTLTVDDLIYPMFVRYGRNVKRAIPSMPGQFQFSADKIASEAERAAKLGIGAVILFGIPEKKDPLGKSGYSKTGVVPKAIRAIKKSVPDLVIITDVCLCEYTSHGHCGVVVKTGKNFHIDDDSTLDLLAKMAVVHAGAGADVIAPSDMMDGRVGAIRDALDGNGYENIPVMSYAAKFASAYYGPFREAAGSTPGFGDRTGYQMDPANAQEALREVALDIEEGADIVMVKPALAYMDLIRMVKDSFGYPTACYNVSGEYAMIKAGAAKGWIDEKRIVLETLLSFKRAGADLILTYHAPDAAKWLKK